MKPKCEMGLRGMPCSKEIRGLVGNHPLVSGYGAVWKEEFIQSEVGARTVKKTPSFREMLAGGAKEAAETRLLG